MVPLYNITTTIPLLSTYTIQYRWRHLITSPNPNKKASTTSYIDRRANKQLNKYTPPPNPRAIAYRACGYSPFLLP
jgi:hypothetical protein